jgi:hypothetical protein
MLDSSGINKLWNKISGYQRKPNLQLNRTTNDMFMLKTEQAELADRVLLLQNDPELAARQYERDVNKIAGNKSEIQQEARRLDSRSGELTLLGF